MLSKLNVRSKLLAMVLPMAVGVCVLSVLGLQTRVAAEGVTQARADALGTTRAATALLHEVQRERTIVVTNTVADAAVEDPQVVAQRSRTDAAALTASRLVTDLDVSALDGATQPRATSLRTNLADAIGSLPSARGSSKRSAEELVSEYDSLAGSLVRSIGALELAADDESRSAVARHWFAQSLESQASAAAQAALYFGGDAGVAAEITDLMSRGSVSMDSFVEVTGDAGREALRRAQQMLAYDISTKAFDQLSTTSGVAAFDAPAATWPNVVAGRLAALGQIESARYDATLSRLDTRAADARRQARTFAASSAAAVLLSSLVAFALGRGIIVSLRRLTDAAREISTERLPALAEALRTGSLPSSAAGFIGIDTSSADEFAEIAEALNELGSATGRIAAEQHRSLQKGIGEIFVNLARRNQSLLDRQIEYIDLLESTERDAEQLDHLFTLDHLATRMRRNAESLLVLAGTEAPRRLQRDVDLADVIRIAVGEVEEFTRVRLVAVDAASVRGAAGSDLAHLLAEIMENGTQYSPPERHVDVIGHRTTDGSYVVTISDSGIGMSAERLAEANQLLAGPPPVGLALSHTLGFIVAGTLAARHDIAIRLSNSATGGVTAEVTVPATIVSDVVAPDRSAQQPFRPAAVSAAARVAQSVAEQSVTEPSMAEPSVAGQPGSEQPGFGWTLDGEYVPAPAARAGAPAARAVAAPAVGRVDPAPPPFDPNQFTEFVATRSTWGDETVSDAAPSPSRLVEALPQGLHFEAGLNSLLGYDPLGASAVESPEAFGEGGAGPQEPLPTRVPGAAAAGFESSSAIGFATRAGSTDDTRGALSRYRNGLSAGRDGSTGPLDDLLADGDGPVRP